MHSACFNFIFYLFSIFRCFAKSGWKEEQSFGLHEGKIELFRSAFRGSDKTLKKIHKNGGVIIK